MKRAIIWIISTIILLSTVLVVQKENKESTVPYLYLATLTGQKEQDKYVIKVSQVGEKEKYVYFSGEREILKTKRVHPLKAEDIQIHVGKRSTDVLAQYGEPHADIGSGFYIPAYITEDAYLISIQVDSDGIISRVAKYDLLYTGDDFPLVTEETKTGDGLREPF